MSPPIIHFDYGMSPYGQKTKALLTLAGVPFHRCDQPVVLPRKDLEALGITYRRIPLLAVGRDVYCDTSLITSVALSKLGGKVATTPADKAWESYGYQTFVGVLSLIPPQVAGDETFVNDRATIFPLLKRPDFLSLRPSGLAELQSRMHFLEHEVLANQPFISGEKLGLADLHVTYGIRWGMNDLGVANEKGVGKEAFPKVWRVLESWPETKAEAMGSKETIEAIKSADLTAQSPTIDEHDPTGLKSGMKVTIESSDAAPGAHPQSGKLIGLSNKEIVLQLESGVHLHFPREGYILRQA